MKFLYLQALISEIIQEYTDKQRAKMGIPTGAVSRGGKWYLGDKYVGKVVKGKFVHAQSLDKPKNTKKTNTVVAPPKVQAPIQQPPKKKVKPRHDRKDVEAAMKKNGYTKIGKGENAVAFVKHDEEVVKVIVPSSHGFQDEDRKNAEKVFDDFYEYTERNKGNPNLIKFRAKKEVEIEGKKYYYISMEKLQRLTRREEDTVVDIHRNVAWGEPLTRKLTPEEEEFRKTLKDVIKAGEKLKYTDDTYGDSYMNVMKRGNTFVIMDPWA